MLRRKGNHEVVKCTRLNVGKSYEISVATMFSTIMCTLTRPWWSRKLAERRSHKEYTPNVVAGATQHACHTG